MIITWADYKKWVADLVKNNHTYFFRGQQDLTWKLETTFQRYAAKNGITWRDYFDKILPDVDYSSAAFGYRIDNLYGDGIHLTVAHKREWSYGFKPDNKTVPLPCYPESPYDHQRE
ncbi:hypothetical protein, partial [Aeromonas caviae]|uniref:hypothetical protein n=1 Tax=Aeromonas caviae TaxID=648 RepID=UPI0038CF3EE7